MNRAEREKSFWQRFVFSHDFKWEIAEVTEKHINEKKSFLFQFEAFSTVHICFMIKLLDALDFPHSLIQEVQDWKF